MLIVILVREKNELMPSASRVLTNLHKYFDGWAGRAGIYIWV